MNKNTCFCMSRKGELSLERCSLDSEDDLRSGRRNVSHRLLTISELQYPHPDDQTMRKIAFCTKSLFIISSIPVHYYVYNNYDSTIIMYVFIILQYL